MGLLGSCFLAQKLSRFVSFKLWRDGGESCSNWKVLGSIANELK